MINDMRNTENNIRRLAICLGILQLFIGIGAVPAGLAMIIDPSGRSLTMPLEMLANSPFSDFLIPGIFLLLINGIGSLIGGIASFLRNKLSGEIAIGLGIFLLGWILAQTVWMGIHWLHIMYFILGAVELILGLILRKKMP